MIEKKLRDKIEQLIARAPALEGKAPITEETRWKAAGEAWCTEAVNAVELAVPDVFNAYRSRMTTAALFGSTPQRVTLIASLLRSLLNDIDAGLVSTLANAIRAETFDNFLDHAVAYRDRGQKDQAGVIAANVFEDTMRKIYADKIDKFSRPELEQVIVALTKNGTITDQQARQVRVAQLVRNKAGHAEWSGFDMDGVNDTIKITKTLIEAHLK